jgi:hypoxanthine phosphoribosyltransferase
VFVEITTLRQDLVTPKNRKVRRLAELYPEVQVKVLYRKDIARLDLKYGLGAASRLAG